MNKNMNFMFIKKKNLSLSEDPPRKVVDRILSIKHCKNKKKYFLFNSTLSFNLQYNFSNLHNFLLSIAHRNRHFHLSSI